MSSIKNKLNLRKILKILIVALILVVIIIVSINILGMPVDRTNNTYKTITIKKNDKIDDIAHNLEKNGIIKNASIYKFLSAITFKTGKYKDGSFLISPCMDFYRISHELCYGISTNSGFKIPPGYKLNQIAKALEQAGFVDKKKFIKAATTIDFSNFDFIDSKIDRKYQLEGYLLPKEYDMNPDANEIMIITTILDAFDNFFTDEYKARASELGLSIKEIITIASIIEKETNIEKEKPLISSVIHNRLNMDKKIDGGFPKIPLSSPSPESIEAALYPKDTDYLFYFYSDEMNGSHVFTDKKSEYNKFKKNYDTILKQQKQQENLEDIKKNNKDKKEINE